jgi:hypothetical protein
MFNFIYKKTKNYVGKNSKPDESIDTSLQLFADNNINEW